MLSDSKANNLLLLGAWPIINKRERAHDWFFNRNFTVSLDEYLFYLRYKVVVRRRRAQDLETNLETDLKINLEIDLEVRPEWDRGAAGRLDRAHSRI